MKLASAILTTPAMVNGSTSRELEASAAVTLIGNYERQLLEIYVHGKLIRVRPFGGVLDMVPAEKQETCSECGKAFDNLQGLSGHMAHKHGVKGATR